MRNWSRSLSLLLGIILGSQLFFPNTAFACHPTIAAEAVCDDAGQLVIHWTAASWEAGVGNPQVKIFINGSEVAEGAFESPSWAFSGSLVAPSGDSAVVMALAVAEWTDTSSGGQSESITVTYPEEPCSSQGSGRFTGGGHQLRVDGARVTRGLTIHCDLMLSNNLEINWQGNQFHMTEHLTTVACTDSPDIVQFPPAAPLDTLIGVGTGRYNGEDGFTIEFTLVDYGEPGSNDQMAIHIYETSNPSNAVLTIPLQVLSGGNLQAHYDQPHK